MLYAPVKKNLKMLAHLGRTVLVYMFCGTANVAKEDTKWYMICQLSSPK